VLKTARSCRHYAMCKIDYLGPGCAVRGGKALRQLLSQGGWTSMPLAEDRVPVTRACVEIADSCDLCGTCDYQCYFVTEMSRRPSCAP